MKLLKTDDFLRSFNLLPRDIQRLCIIQETRFAENWRDPRLHVKKVKELEHVFSFRITRRYRVFFYFHTADTAVLFDVDHRKDAYR